jgi:uncharacterized short protein YbdD (DUF466 family)
MSPRGWLKNGCGTDPMFRLVPRFRALWQVIRTVSGEDAYERYLDHWRTHHSEHEDAPLDRKTFYKRREDRKWNGINRCC